jgi:hypothetical protein
VGWMLFLEGVRVGGIYGMKEAGFEAASKFEMAKAFKSAAQQCRAARRRTKQPLAERMEC